MYHYFSKTNMQKTVEEYLFILLVMPILGCLFGSFIMGDIFYGGDNLSIPIMFFCYLSSFAFTFLLSLHFVSGKSIFKLSKIEEVMFLGFFLSCVLSPLFYAPLDGLIQTKDVLTETKTVELIVELLFVTFFYGITNLLFLFFSNFFMQKDPVKQSKPLDKSLEERKQMVLFDDPLLGEFDEKVAYLHNLPLTGRESQDMKRVLQLVEDSIKTYQAMYAPEVVYFQSLRQNLQHANAFLDGLITKQNETHAIELRKYQEKLKTYNRTIKNT